MSKVYYRVNGKEITFDQVHNFVHQMGPEGNRYHNEEGFKQIADELLNQEVLLLDAKENGLENSEEYIAEVEFAKEQILKQFAIRKLLKEAEVSDEEAKKLYDENKDQLSPVYKFNASHILVDEEDLAKEIKSKIDSGESFEDLAKEYSKDGAAQNGGNLGEFLSGQMVPQFESALLEMDVDTISEPVKTQFGYHLIKLIDKKVEKENTFENFKDEIKRSLLSQKQQELYVNRTNELKEKYEVESVE